MNTTNCGSRNATYSVAPFNPFAEFEREIDRVFGGALSGQAKSTVPAPLDVREEADRFVVSVDLPGLRREDIQIAFNEGELTLTAQRNAEADVKAESYLRRERYFGGFERRLTVRTPVNGDGIKASYRDGVLTVTLPKTDAAKPKQISVSE